MSEKKSTSPEKTTCSPRCPFCNAQGVQHIARQALGLFYLIYCGQCGAIYGVIPKPEEPPPVVTEPAASLDESPPPPQPGSVIELPAVTPPPPQITPERARAMLSSTMQPGSTLYRKVRSE